MTGSDSGICQGVATEFAREGASVVVIYTDAEGADRIRRATVIRLNVRDPEQVREDLGAPDSLVDNAGGGGEGEVGELSLGRWDDTLKTNLYGPFSCARGFIRLRRTAGGGGRIINVTSVHEEIPSAGAGAYDAAKGGLRNLTRTLALELAPDGISVTNIAPGMILTPMNQAAIDDPQKYAQQVQHIPLKRAGLPWEIGCLSVYLASDDGGLINGTTLTIDGGLEQQQGQGA